MEIEYATGENHLAEGTAVSISDSSSTGDTKAPTNGTDITPTPEITEEPLDVLNYDFILNKKTLRFHKPMCDSVTEMKEKNKEGYNGTAEELIAAGYDPCNKCCSEWVTPTATPEPTWEPTHEPQPAGTDYVLNTNTRKFHYPSCRSVKTMKPKNTQYYNGTRDEVIAKGYDPCQNCNP